MKQWLYLAHLLWLRCLMYKAVAQNQLIFGQANIIPAFWSLIFFKQLFQKHIFCRWYVGFFVYITMIMTAERELFVVECFGENIVHSNGPSHVMAEHLQVNSVKRSCCWLVSCFCSGHTMCFMLVLLSFAFSVSGWPGPHNLCSVFSWHHDFYISVCFVL